jgi:hypothetical protein
MSHVPEEPPSWQPSEQDADEVLLELRAQLERAKARMSEHRDQMRAAGLARPPAPEAPKS